MDDISSLPVVIAAYSGGYLATAYCLAGKEGSGRIVGVILLDALFGEEPKFEAWIVDNWRRTFFVSAYSKSSAPLDNQLEQALSDKDVPFATSVPASIAPGSIVFQAALDAGHEDFAAKAWVSHPLAELLRRIRLERAP